MPRIQLPITAAQCGRFFISGLATFFGFLLLILLLPSSAMATLLWLKWLWLGVFALTMLSYLLLLLQRLGWSLLKEPVE